MKNCFKSNKKSIAQSLLWATAIILVALMSDDKAQGSTIIMLAIAGWYAVSIGNSQCTKK